MMAEPRVLRSSTLAELLRVHRYLHSEDSVAAVEERVKEKGCSPLQAAFDIRKEFHREFEAGRPRRASRVEKLLRENGYAVDPAFVSTVMRCCETEGCSPLDAVRDKHDKLFGYEKCPDFKDNSILVCNKPPLGILDAWLKFEAGNLGWKVFGGQQIFPFCDQNELKAFFDCTVFPEEYRLGEYRAGGRQDYLYWLPRNEYRVRNPLFKHNMLQTASKDQLPLDVQKQKKQDKKKKAVQLPGIVFNVNWKASFQEISFKMKVKSMRVELAKINRT
jgi:hypothetical protein